MRRATYLITLIVLVSISGCNSPRDSRSVGRGDDDDNSNAFAFNGNPLSPTLATPVPQSGSNQGNSNAATPTPSAGSSSANYTFPVGFENCNGELAVNGSNFYKYGASSTSANLGLYNLCKSSGMDTILVQFQATINTRVCFIPTTFTDSTGVNLTAPVANTPSCLTPKASGQITEVRLNRDRPGFQNSIIRGVMIMRDETNYYGYPFNNNLNNAYAFYQCINYKTLSGSEAYCSPFKDVGAYINHIF